MLGSDSCKVIICVNKCGLYLDNIKEELEQEENPIDFLKERYVKKLNEYFETSSKLSISKEHILFTDWKVGDEGRKFGIEGVEEVKNSIKEYLVEFNIFNREDSKALDKAVSPPVK